MIVRAADGTMHAQRRRLTVGTYKQGTALAPDFHVFAYGPPRLLMFGTTCKDWLRVDWQHGGWWCSLRPPDVPPAFQHVARPARYRAVAFGGLRYTLRNPKRHVFKGMDVTVRKAVPIAYEDKDKRFTALFDELARYGVKSRWARSSLRRYICNAPGTCAIVIDIDRLGCSWAKGGFVPARHCYQLCPAGGHSRRQAPKGRPTIRTML